MGWARIIDRNFDKALSKYLEDMLERAKYFPKDARQETSHDGSKK